MVIFGRVLQDLVNYLSSGDKDRDAKSFALDFSGFGFLIYTVVLQILINL